MHICVLSYVEEAIQAEQRIKRGERQLYCSECGGLWRWPEECKHEGRLTEKEFATMARRIKRQVAKDYPSQEAQYIKAVREAS